MLEEGQSTKQPRDGWSDTKSHERWFGTSVLSVAAATTAIARNGKKQEQKRRNKSTTYCRASGRAGSTSCAVLVGVYDIRHMLKAVKAVKGNKHR